MLSGTGRERLHVAPAAGIAEMEGSFNFRFFPEEVRAGIRARANEMLGDRHYRRGCAGYDYIQLATGRWHYAVYWKKMPWDHAPGLLIHGEAGRLFGLYRRHALQPRASSAAASSPRPTRPGWHALRDQVVGSVPSAV